MNQKKIVWNNTIIIGPPSGANSSGSAPDLSFVTRKFQDIQYSGKSDSQKLDIYLPEKAQENYPVIIYIHGGAFIGGDKYDSELIPVIKALKKGYAVVSINYRLSDEEPWPAQIFDVKAAISFVRVNAGYYHLYADKLVLWGSSAGAHLASLAGLSAESDIFSNNSLEYPDISFAVSAVIDWFDPINFQTMDDQWEVVGIDGQKHDTPDSFESFLMREQITKIPDKIAAANPENYININSPAFFIQHGRRDDIIPYLQSQEFAEKLIHKIGKEKVFFELLPEGMHGDEIFAVEDNIDKVFLFLDKQLSHYKLNQ